MLFNSSDIKFQSESFAVHLSVGVQNNPFLRWGGQNTNLKEIVIPLQNTSDLLDNDEGFHSVNLTEVMQNASEFRLLVRAHIVDNKGCSGKESNFTYRGKLCYELIEIIDKFNSKTARFSIKNLLLNILSKGFRTKHCRCRFNNK